MKHIAAFPYMLNDIFSELDAAASIVISFNTVSDLNQGREERSIMLTGVNGYKSLTTYYDYLVQLKKTLLDNLIEAQNKMEAEASRLFIKQASRYAGIFRRTGERLLDELHELSRLVMFLPLFFFASDQNQRNETIQVNLSVPELSAALRMFHEFQVINIRNKELLCRLVASTFSTRVQKKISPASLKNHFDSPKPETLERVCAGLSEIMKNSQKLKKVK